MKSKFNQLLFAGIFLSALFPSLSTVRAQSTAFTYQGRLNDASGAATGLYDFRFTIYDAVTNGAAVGGPLTNAVTAVSNGLFTVTLDFGAGLFTGANRWLEISVRTNGNVNPHTPLAPRQPVTATPYAITAGNVLAGGLPSGTYGNAVTFNNGANSFSGSYTGNGGALTNVSASTLGGLSALNFWQVGGNNVAVGQFLGSTNNQTLELRANGVRVLRLDGGAISGKAVSEGYLAPNGAPNVIGGSPLNFVALNVVGATIGGGGATNYEAFSYSNSVSVDFATIGGGVQNTIAASDYDYTIFASTIGGGTRNTIQSNAIGSTIGGGGLNQIQTNALLSTISGGVNNQVTGQGSVVGGGGYDGNDFAGNSAGGNASTIGGGLGNTILAGATGAFIGGGASNSIGPNSGRSTVAGGSGNAIQANAPYATVGGGVGNVASAEATFIGGGTGNTNLGGGSFIGGGFYNRAENFDAVVGGGGFNVNSGYRAFIGGGEGNRISDTGSYATVGGGYGNLAPGTSSTVGGGGLNSAAGQNATVPGGASSIALGDYSFAAGRRAKALHPGAFVWADSTDTNFVSTATNQFNVRAGGGVRLETGGAGMMLDGVNVLSGLVPSASLAGSYGNAVTLNNAANSFSGNGTGLTNVNAAALGGLGAGSFWTVGGNTGTGGSGLGTVDSQPLQLMAGNRRALQLETRFVSLSLFDSWSAVNTLGGASGNVISNGVMGGTIAGGGAVTNHLFGSESSPNTVLDNFATVGGGLNNTAGSASANFDDARSATVAGGEGNLAGNVWATVGGGQRNTSSGQGATVGGGFQNASSGYAATVGGGEFNGSGHWGAVGGGRNNNSGGFFGTVGGGEGNTTGSQWATVGGGNQNNSSDLYATVGGGDSNIGSGLAATVGGGSQNISSQDYATVGGGVLNISSAYAATVPGGFKNVAAADYGFAAGHRAKANHIGAFVWADSTDADFASAAADQFLIRAAGGVGINKNNPASALDVNGTVSATRLHWATASEISDDQGGSIELGNSLDSGTVPFIDFHYGVGAVQDYNVRLINNADGQLTCQGGFRTAGSLVVDQSGQNNGTVSAASLTFGNASGEGIASRRTGGGNSFGLDFYTGAFNRMTILNDGRVGINTLAPDSSLTVNGSANKPGGGAWTLFSDARLKKNIRPLAGVLEKLLALHGVSFEYKEPEKLHELAGERIGMIAQEVEPVFPDWVETGADGYKRLTFRGFEALTVEALRELRAEKDAQISTLEKQNAAQKTANACLEARLAALENAVASLMEKSSRTLGASPPVAAER